MKTAKPRSFRFPASIEVMEARRLLASLVVTTTADLGAGSLRQAILDANADRSLDSITFAIPASDGGHIVPPSGVEFWSITPATPLPALTTPVVIDGYTQSGARANRRGDLQGDDAVLSIFLDGSVAGSRANGLVLAAGSDGSTIRGLAIGNFDGEGIEIDSNANRIAGNFVGTGTSGVSAAGNRDNGVQILGAADNTVGGSSAGDRNLVSGNRVNGIKVSSSISQVDGGIVLAARNVISNDFIGVGSTGRSLANANDGIQVFAAPANTIGGADVGAGNLIRNNQGNGISLRGPNATGNVLQANVIGLAIGPDGSGSSAPNLLNGILVQNAPGNTIGGVNSLNADGTFANLVGNVISGNNQSGILLIYTLDPSLNPNNGPLRLSSGGANLITGADRNLIQGNVIGTDPLGSKLGVGNGGQGIYVISSGDNTIGGATRGAGNLISGNESTGITILGPTLPSFASGQTRDAARNLVIGNQIGTDVTGYRQVRNLQQGVSIVDATSNTVGGTSALARNIISGNKGVGLQIDGAFSANGQTFIARDNRVIGNFIGPNIAGTGLLNDADNPAFLVGNFSDGVVIDLGAESNSIGGPGAGEGNIISGNGVSGVHLARAGVGNAIQGNLIGTDVSGNRSLGNAQAGVLIESTTANLIGGLNTLNPDGSLRNRAGNVIASNETGVSIKSDSGANLIQGNNVGVGADGSTPLGNVAYGFLLLSGTGNTIGGASAGARNVISANGQGITIESPGPSGDLIEGNYIGLDASGRLPRGNDRVGIAVNDSSSTTIGGTAPGAGNVISANQGPGIVIAGNSGGNLVLGNIVGLDASGSIAENNDNGELRRLGNLGPGVQFIDALTNTVGGTTAGAGNVISGNDQSGVDISGARPAVLVIEGNLIGLGLQGQVRLGNKVDGVRIDRVGGVIIGGSVSASLNVISGNQGNGVEVIDAAQTEILGNRIGTDTSGSVTLGNDLNGVLLNAAHATTVGGLTSSSGNLISGNVGNGVRVTGAGSSESLVLGNRIGTDATGQARLGNAGDGVLLDATSGVTVGGPAAEAGNVISANRSYGVEFRGASTALNFVSGNLVGTDATGTLELGNALGGVFVNDAASNTVAGNLISGNSGPGVRLFDVQTIDNLLSSNKIGTNLSGLAAVPNDDGVLIDGAYANTVSGNLISGNRSSGVVITGVARSSTLQGNSLFGNTIGPDATGASRLSASTPQQAGLLLNDAAATTIGGSILGHPNVISGNTVGIVIAGFNSQGNWIAGNLIGTNTSGTAAIPNTVGIYVNGAPSNTIGGGTADSRNVISGNSSIGIEVYGNLATGNPALGIRGNVIQGNDIGTNLAGTAALDQLQQVGVYIELASAVTVGGTALSAGNLISGNSVAGVYVFNVASGNLIVDNRIGVSQAGGKLGNGQYGVLLYNAARNTVVMTGPSKNRIANSGIGNVREFTGAAVPSTGTVNPPSRTPAKHKTVKASHPLGPKKSLRAAPVRGSRAKNVPKS